MSTDPENLDMFEPETRTYRPCNAVETRAHVDRLLRPIVDKLRREEANPLAVSEAFAKYQHEFMSQAQAEILESNH